jgi:ribonuclease Z
LRCFMIDVCLLGCGGMMPLPQRRLTALLFRHNGKMILIDCGEGTQVGVKLAGWGFKPIDAILFTHYHADHVAGLPGLLLTLANSGKTEPLLLAGPPGLRQVVAGLSVIAPVPFDLILTELPDNSMSEESIGEVVVKSIPGDHRIPCLSYSLEVKRAGMFDARRAAGLGLPVQYWNRLQKGGTVIYEGKRYDPEMVLGKPRKGLKIAYCTDTRPTRSLAEFCRDSDLLVCEGIYGEDEKKAGAIEKKHMIFSEAAAIAKESGSRELWLTHYSPSMKDPEAFADVARTIFPNTVPGRDLMTKTLQFQNDFN